MNFSRQTGFAKAPPVNFSRNHFSGGLLVSLVAPALLAALFHSTAAAFAGPVVALALSTCFNGPDARSWRFGAFAGIGVFILVAVFAGSLLNG